MHAQAPPTHADSAAENQVDGSGGGPSDGSGVVAPVLVPLAHSVSKLKCFTAEISQSTCMLFLRINLQ